MTDDFDYYAILGVRRDASNGEIRDAFAEFEPIVDIYYPVDRDTGQLSGHLHQGAACLGFVSTSWLSANTFHLFSRRKNR